MGTYLKLDGGECFEFRVCMSLILSKPIEINNVNFNDAEDVEARISFLKLLEKINIDARFEINDMGDRIKISPGMLHGGKFSFNCHNSEALGYYIQYLLLLGPFCRKPIEAELFGVTNKFNSVSVETVTYGFSKFMSDFNANFELKMIKRGAYPRGEGHVILKTKPTEFIKSIEKVKTGKIQKVRGTTWCCRVNPTFNKRTMCGAKEVVNKKLSDVYFVDDYRKKDQSGPSPGHGIVVQAISTEGCVYVAEMANLSKAESNDTMYAEDVGGEAANKLFDQISYGGIVGRTVTPFLLVLLAMSKKDVSKVVLCKPYSPIGQILRDIKNLCGVKYKIEEIGKNSNAELYRGIDECLYICVGCGMINLNSQIR